MYIPLCTLIGLRQFTVRISDILVNFVVETAKIMPAKFARFRSLRLYNPDKDFRKNLYDQYYQKDSTEFSG